MAGFDGAMAISPMEGFGWSSKSDCQLWPPLTVLKRPPRGRADVDDARVGFDHRDVVHAAAHGGRSDAAETQILHRVFGSELCGGLWGEAGKRKSAGGDAGQHLLK